jgi:hypothetical protein
MYSEAVWMADAEPEMAWLLLTSAAETAAADYWENELAGQPSDEDLLRRLKPALFVSLQEAAGTNANQVLGVVVTELKGTLRAMFRFLEFLLAFTPKPPSPRPAGFAIDWSREALEKSLKLIYSYRSKALHEGVPVPSPMSDPPFPSDAASGTGERAWGEHPAGGVAARGGVWKSEDLPMNLHAYEHLVRGAIVGYLESLCPTPLPAVPAKLT